MREILFRGFHEDKNGKEIIYIDSREIKGEWVEGHNIILAEQGQGRAFIVPTGEYIDDFRTDTGRLILIIPQIEVIPETIGQYTGLTDKNGRNIFEGDVLLVKTERESIAKETRHDEYITKGVVVFEDGTFVLQGKGMVLCTYWGLKCLNSAIRFPEHEVIGNIFSNPEILRSEDK